MKCPSEVAEVLREILGVGLLRIRSAGSAGDAGRCAVEADHIHNLPSLLADYSIDRLRYYWEAERPTFISRCPTEGLPGFDLLWNRLAPLVVHETVPSGNQ